MRALSLSLSLFQSCVKILTRPYPLKISLENGPRSKRWRDFLTENIGSFIRSSRPGILILIAKQDTLRSKDGQEIFLKSVLCNSANQPFWYFMSSLIDLGCLAECLKVAFVRFQWVKMSLYHTRTTA